MATKRYEFHYVPSPTGEISGRAVLRQTEDAINGIGEQAAQSDDNSALALTTAKQAVDIATVAQSTANNAIASAESAVEKVTTLTTVVNGYDAKINEAVSASQTAVQASTEAKTSAGSAVTTADNAEKKADEAVSIAKDAVSKGDDAQASVDTANAQAQAAKEEAIKAQQQAELAKKSADGAAESAASSAESARTALDTAYAMRIYGVGSLTAGGTVLIADLIPQGNIKAGDQVVDVNGQIYTITTISDDDLTATLSETSVDLTPSVSYAVVQKLSEAQLKVAQANIGLVSMSLEDIDAIFV